MDTRGRLRSPRGEESRGGPLLEDVTRNLTPALAAALQRFGVDPQDLEASVRRDDDGGLRGGRMIVERAPDGLDVALAEATGTAYPEPFATLTEAARSFGLTTIAGWDLEGRALKRYVNASDASPRVRRDLLAALGWPPLPEGTPPHVFGLNATPRGVERKLYAQRDDLRALAGVVGQDALAARLVDAGLAAGGLLSFDVPRDGGAPIPRSLFAALRPAEPGALEAALAPLPGWSVAAIVEHLPFPPASPCFVGVSISHPRRWTTYFKPEGAPARRQLEPTAVFRTPDGELAIHVEPDRAGERAYVRVAGLAASYRVREGAPAQTDVERLFAWIEVTLPEHPRLDTPPPAPWRRVEER